MLVGLLHEAGALGACAGDVGGGRPIVQGRPSRRRAVSRMLAELKLAGQTAYLLGQKSTTMSDDLEADLADLPSPTTSGSAQRVQFGRPLPPQQQLLLYSPEEWEEFIHEWAHNKKRDYKYVLRFGGANDCGIDIAGFENERSLLGTWDNFQCKHYGRPLQPGDANAEIAKILWHSFSGVYAPPRAYYFVAPRGCGPTLSRLLMDPAALKKKLQDKWDTQCADKITSAKSIPLEGDFARYVDSFDFSIFRARSLLDIIEDQRGTHFFAVRFGGGLPDRPDAPSPPDKPTVAESRYIEQLFEAYGDHTGVAAFDRERLEESSELKGNYSRQREFFYQAEGLRNFARDNVPDGTFGDLQAEIHAGVADVEGAAHTTGFSRLLAVLQAASQLQLTSNALISVTRVQDRKGICHQLANQDQLTWVKR